MPLISVLLPNYNNAAFLKDAIDSILNQTFSDFELLIVDDGSTDNSISIIESYTDKRIRLIKKVKNSGIVDALNIGLDSIESKYVARMDGDDISDPTRLEKLVFFLEKNPSFGVCSSQLKLFGNKNDVWPIETDHDILKAALVRGVTTPHAASMFRMSVLNDNSVRYSKDCPHMEDYDIFFRIKKLTDFHNISEILYFYRVLEHNVTVKNSHTKWQRYKLIYRRVLEELEIEPSNENLELHIDLYHQEKPLNTPEELLKYKNRILSNNHRLKIYPEKALSKFTENCWNSLFCRLVDTDTSNFKKLKLLNVPITWAQKYYYYRKVF